MPVRPRIYTDTSALGGCFEPEFRIGSERLLRRFEKGEMRWWCSTSAATLMELSPTPARVANISSIGYPPDSGRHHTDI